MSSAYLKVILLVLVVGLLTACGAQSAATPASAPTEEILPASQAPSNTPAATETPAAAEAPATELATTTETIATEPAAQGAGISFAGDVFPIIQSRCINCHGGQRTEEGLVLTSHASVMAGSDNGAVVIPGDAANSLLVELVAAQKMPKRGPKLTPPQVQIITDWINQGALNN